VLCIGYWICAGRFPKAAIDNSRVSWMRKKIAKRMEKEGGEENGRRPFCGVWAVENRDRRWRKKIRVGAQVSFRRNTHTPRVY